MMCFPSFLDGVFLRRKCFRLNIGYHKSQRWEGGRNCIYFTGEDLHTHQYWTLAFY